MISGGNSECICRGALSSLSFHRIFRLATLFLLRIVSSFCQLVRCGLPPSVGQSEATAAMQQSETAIKPQICRMTKRFLNQIRRNMRNTIAPIYRQRKELAWKGNWPQKAQKAQKKTMQVFLCLLCFLWLIPPFQNAAICADKY